MSLGKRNEPDFIPSGTAEPNSGDDSDNYKSPVDNNVTFTPDTTNTDQGVVDLNDPVGVSMPA